MKKTSKYIAKQDMLIVDAMQRLDENAGGVLYIVDSEDRLIGSLSDGDIRRWILRSGDVRTTVDQAMQAGVRFVEQKNRDNASDVLIKNKITSLPIVDDEGHIVDIYIPRKKQRETSDALKKTAVIIMAGGEGTRLYPYTKILPKPLIPIDEVPILERIMNRFASYGAEDFYLIVNYRKEMIRSYFYDLSPDYRVHFIDEDKPLGTAGGIRLIGDSFDEPVIVTNCDTLILAEYDQLLQEHKSAKNRMTIVSSVKETVMPYGILHVGEDGSVRSIEEKPSYSNLINTGMYVLDPELLSYIPEDTFFHMTDLIEVLMEKGESIGMYPISENSFLDMGEFEQMQRMERLLSERVRIE